MGLLGDLAGLNRAFFLVPVLFAVFIVLMLIERAVGRRQSAVNR